MKKQNFILFISISIFLFIGFYQRVFQKPAQIIFNTQNPPVKINTPSYDLTKFFVIKDKTLINQNLYKNIDKYLNNLQNKTILININTAPKSVLVSLPSIGNSIAQNIIEYRQKNGNFKNISEIKNVKGIGNKTYEKIKNFITIGG